LRKAALIFLLLIGFTTARGSETASDAPVLYWQGYEFTVASFVTDRDAFTGYDWPENGRLVQVNLNSKNKTRIPENVFTTYSHEFVLLNGPDGVFRPFEIRAGLPDGSSLVLTYRIEKPGANDSYKIDIWRRGALWTDAAYRGSGPPFKFFAPKDPKPFLYATALEDFSLYRYDKAAAIINPDEAFKELSDEMRLISDGLKEIFNNYEIKPAESPDFASVVIGVNIQYPLAGKYGTGGAIRAYNCVLTLTAYEAKTHKKLTELIIGSYFGNTVSVQAGATATWKFMPSPAAADTEKKNEFIKVLREYFDSLNQ